MLRLCRVEAGRLARGQKPHIAEEFVAIKVLSYWLSLQASALSHL